MRPAQRQERSPSTIGPVKSMEVNGTRLAYLAYIEQGAGEPIVFVHGAVSDYRTWSPQLDALSEQYHAIAYSRRYHYPNKWASDRGDYSQALHAADLIAFLRALKLGPAHLIGHSYGGALAASVANTHPELVRSLVLGEPSVFSMPTTVEVQALLAQHKREFEQTLQIFERGEQERAVKEYLRIVVGMDVFDQLPIAVQTIIMDNVRTLGPMLKTFYSAPPFTSDDARKMRAPTLLITGSRSPKLYSLVMAELHACLSNSQLVVLAGASHGLQIEQPAEFNRAVLQFQRNDSTVMLWGT